jgi:hypothetical protein
MTAALATPMPDDASDELQLLDEVGRFFDDPLGFVLTCFPWGEQSTPLENFTAPTNGSARSLRK